MLGARLGSALVDSGDPDEAERGERILREVIEDQAGTAHNGALPRPGSSSPGGSA